MTITDAARIYSLSETTIRRWIADGRLATIKRGRATHVSPAQLERVADAATNRARPPVRRLSELLANR